MTIIEHRYAPKGAARALFRTFDPEILLEGPAGTGKTRAVLEHIDALCRSYNGVRALICRATRVSMTESVLVTAERDVLTPDLLTRDVSRAHRDHYDYPGTGSTIVCGGLDNPERLFSTEWDLVYVAEAIEITEDAWEKFARAMRNKAIPMGVGGGPQRPGEAQAVDGEGRKRYWTQRIADCNPGAPSHWLNQRATSGRMARLKSRHEDNPSVTSDFLDGLRALTGHRRARLYEGRWVSAEGAVFPEFSTDRHVCTPFAIPPDWPQYVGVDPGYDHPCAILWLTVAPNGCIYVVDELYRGGLPVADHARDIHARNAGRTVRRYYADPQHAFSSTAQSPKTIAMQFKECGLTFSPWPRSTDVQAMVEAVRERLRSDRLKVFSSCANTISEFQSWRYKRTAKGEIPAGDDQYEDANNHALDVVKGLIAARIGSADAKIQVGGQAGRRVVTSRA